MSGNNTIIGYVFFICVGVTFAFNLLSYPLLSVSLLPALTLILLTWRIWWATNNASRWQMKFHSAFKGLNQDNKMDGQDVEDARNRCEMQLWRNGTVWEMLVQIRGQYYKSIERK